LTARQTGSASIAQRRRILDQCGVFLRHLVHLCDGSVDLLDARGLLLAGGGDLSHEVGHAVLAAKDLLQPLTEPVSEFASRAVKTLHKQGKGRVKNPGRQTRRCAGEGLIARACITALHNLAPRICMRASARGGAEACTKGRERKLRIGFGKWGFYALPSASEPG
jgi:hypothetical protein